MLNKLLIKVLGKHFKKFSPEQKQSVREMANKNAISETTEKNQKQKVKKRRTKKMADEKEVKKEELEAKEVESENKEVEEEKSTEVAEDKVEKVEETKKEPKEEAKEEATAPQVSETEPSGNGIRVEDLVTKEMLAERLAALEAKFDAVVKENSDLKDQLSNKNDELNGMKDKYENKDFGGFQRQGVMQKDRFANSSFEEYSKAFM